MLQITWLTVALAWGTIAVLRDRNNMPYDPNDPDATQRILSEQNAWSFGQIVPVVLLILPFLALVEVSYGEWRAFHLSKVRITYKQYKERSIST